MSLTLINLPHGIIHTAVGEKIGPQTFLLNFPEKIKIREDFKTKAGRYDELNAA